MASDSYDLLFELGRLAGENPGGGLPGASPAKGHPKLRILVGEAVPEMLAQFRAQLPQQAYLLHAHPPCSEALAKELVTSRPKGERTLFLEITRNDEMLAKLSLFLKKLRPDSATISAQNSKNPALAETAERLRAALGIEMQNVKVDRMSGLVRLRCTLLNLGLLGADKTLLSARASSTKLPALVCGAGPSLTAQMDFIVKNAERFAIVACGHAAIRMKEAGIEPDFVVEADPRCRINWDRSKAVFEKAPLAALTCADPAVAARFKRRIWFEGDSQEGSEVFEFLGLRIPRIAISRGVIVTAVDFAFRLGCERVALAGCDLALGADGSSHAGDRRADGDDLSLLEVPGAKPGSMVKTTLDFNEIRIALETCARQSGRCERIFNCSASGARIEGVRQTTLEEFAARFGAPGGAKSLELIERPLPSDLADGLLRLSKRFEKAAEDSERASKATLALRETLRAPAFDQARFQKAKDECDEALESATPMASTKIISLAWNKAEDLCDETPGSNTRDDDASAKLFQLSKQTRLTASLCRELKEDVDCARASLAAPGTPLSRDPMDFQTFRNLAVETLAQSNPALAAAIKGGSLPSVEEEGFSLHLRFEDLPHVSKILPDGRKIQFSGLLSGALEAKKLVDDFAKSFNPRKEIAAIVAPGSYFIVEEFAKTFPGAPCLLVEPWPALLAELSRRCCPVHRVQGVSIAVAASEAFPAWRTQLKMSLAAFRAQGLEPKPLLNPKTAELPEVESILEMLKA